MNLDPVSRRPRGGRRRRNRYAAPRTRLLRPLAGAVLIAALGFGWAAAGGGCSLAGGAAGFAASPFLSARERAEKAEAQADAAVERMRRGETAGADDALAAAVALLDPLDGGDGYTETAGILLRRGTPEAMVAMMRLLERATREPARSWDPALWSMLAEAAEKTGDADRAKHARAEAESRAEALVAQGEAAVGAATATMEEPPDPRETRQTAERLLRAGLYYAAPERADRANALRAFDAAEKLMPEDPRVLNAKGYTLADLGDAPAHFGQAVDLTRRALEKVPKEPAVLDSYGWALFRRGDAAKKDHEAARRVLREAADAAPYVAEIRLHLGAVYAALGQPRDAALELNRALLLDPLQKAQIEPAIRALPAPYNVVGGPIPAPSPSSSPSP